MQTIYPIDQLKGVHPTQLSGRHGIVINELALALTLSAPRRGMDEGPWGMESTQSNHDDSPAVWEQFLTEFATSTKHPTTAAPEQMKGHPPKVAEVDQYANNFETAHRIAGDPTWETRRTSEFFIEAPRRVVKTSSGPHPQTTSEATRRKTSKVSSRAKWSKTLRPPTDRNSSETQRNEQGAGSSPGTPEPKKLATTVGNQNSNGDKMATNHPKQFYNGPRLATSAVPRTSTALETIERRTPRGEEPRKAAIKQAIPNGVQQHGVFQLRTDGTLARDCP